MADWFSYLLFAVFFYMMMRHGCGSHMVHGRKNKDDNQHVDPVCGKNVSPEQGYGKMHDKSLYRFCSRTCLDKFESDPNVYLKK